MNAYIQNENGQKQYVPVSYDANGRATTAIETLAPGQKIVYEYVAYNAINYDGIAYFKKAAITEFEGIIDNIETGSFHKERYSFTDYQEKLDNILSGSDAEVVAALEYILSDENYCYVHESRDPTTDACEALYIDSKVPALGHSFTNYVSDNNATCTKDGTKTAKCDRCDATNTLVDDGSMISHNESEWVIDRMPTCTESGSKSHNCLRCDYYETIDIDPLGHDYSTEWTVDKDETCTEAGLKSHHCLRCDSKSDETEIPATGHNYTSVVTEPTCTTDGYTTYTCSVCGYSYNGDIVNALVHDMGEYVQIKAPTCTEVGTEKSICSRCDYYETRDIAALGHDCSTEWTVDKVATCTEVGYKHKKCSICGQIIKTENIPATGHKFVKEIIEPTCEEDGLIMNTCTVCGVEETVEILSSIGHIDSDSDGNCDSCGKQLDANNNCSCMCHKSGFAGFIYKVICIFWKLFKINKTCSCGAVHY